MSKNLFGQMNRQLALSLRLNNEATLEGFCWADNALLQQQILKTLQEEGERFIYLWGSAGCGKSHLLQACCQFFNHNQSAIYLPLQFLKALGPEALEGMAEQALICIDDIETVAGDIAWEEGLFHLYNRIREQEKGVLIIAGNAAPSQLSLRLPDLRSRLSWGLVFQLLELSDENKLKTLKHHAEQRGIQLPTIVGEFLLKRCARNMHDLYTLLNRLDEASLAAQRKITIPFVKSILGI